VEYALKIIRFKFKKNEKVMYISHIEMMNAFTRALRRADFDVVFTQGFNPGMKLVFALPLPVGVSSDSEYVDIWFNQYYKCQYVIDKLAQALPTGFELLEANSVEKSNKKGPVDILSYIYKIDYKDETSFSVLCKAGAKGNLHPRLLLKALEKYTDCRIIEKSINRNKLFLKVQ